MNQAWCTILLLGAMSSASCVETPSSAAMERRRLVPDLRIGAEDRGAAYQFTEIRQVVASDSLVFVLSAEVSDIRVFDRRGQLVRTIGRRGGGPGEFGEVSAIGLHGDTLWTIDNGLRRISYFATTGALLSASRLPALSADLGRADQRYFAYPMAVLRDGSLLGFGGTSAQAIATGQVTATPLLHLANAAAPSDTIGWVPIVNEQMTLRWRGGMIYRIQPFSDAPLTAYAPGAGMLFIAQRFAHNGVGAPAVRIIALRVNGDTAWTRQLPYVPRRLDAHLVDSVRSSLVRAMSQRIGAADVERALFVPEFATPISAILAGEDGTLWIAWEGTGDATRFTVLGADGVPVAEVTAPAETRLRSVGHGIAWGEALDENDVPSLVRFQVIAGQ